MKFLNQEQFTEMWKLQDSLNIATSGPDWKGKNQNWNLAIKSEIMEFFDYIGWKWWKEPDKVKKPTDLQARLELVDIWHFLLSRIIEVAEQDGIWEDHIFEQIEASESLDLDADVSLLQRVDHGNLSLMERLEYLDATIRGCEWSWEELYKAYIGKVALNNFRQDHGYKEGTYQKIWGYEHDPDTLEIHTGLEDNYFLEQILSELSLTPGALTYEAVYHKLDIAYLVRTNN